MVFGLETGNDFALYYSLLFFILTVCRSLNISDSVAHSEDKLSSCLKVRAETISRNSSFFFFFFSFRCKILLFIRAATNACPRKILIVFVLTSVTASNLRCDTRLTHRVPFQMSSCCTAPLVCNLFVCVSRAVQGGCIFSEVPPCTFPGLFHAPLGTLTEKLALLIIFSLRSLRGLSAVQLG